MAAPIPKGADKIRLPFKIECVNESSIDRLYTRLEWIQERKQLPPEGKTLEVWSSESKKNNLPKEDEIAIGWKGAYYSANLGNEEYDYNLWTCDTEDRFYSFQTGDLILPGHSTIETKELSGKLKITVRDLEEDFDLNCTAHYKR